jgi:hypothetical protein
MSTATESTIDFGTQQEADYRPESGDNERFSHYVPTKAWDNIISGEPVTALCGKKWHPTRDPSRFPVCPTCKELYHSLPPGDSHPLSE